MVNPDNLFPPPFPFLYLYDWTFTDSGALNYAYEKIKVGMMHKTQMVKYNFTIKVPKEYLVFMFYSCIIIS